MRTTVSISDEILLASKRRARERGMTLGQLVDEALQRELNEPRGRGEAPAIPVFTAGTGPRPGIDLSSNRALVEALDESTGLDQLR